MNDEYFFVHKLGPGNDADQTLFNSMLKNNIVSKYCNSPRSQD